MVKNFKPSINRKFSRSRVIDLTWPPVPIYQHIDSKRKDVIYDLILFNDNP